MLPKVAWEKVRDSEPVEVLGEFVLGLLKVDGKVLDVVLKAILGENARALAPGSWFNSVSPEVYVKRFNEEILGPLNPKATWDALHQLVRTDQGEQLEPVLLCWEKSTDPNSWCHRALVAAWFEKALDIKVPELGWETFDGGTTGLLAHPLMPLRAPAQGGLSL